MLCNCCFVCLFLDDTIIGHLPREHSKIYSCFLKQCGTVSSEVIGKYKHSADEGDLEIPR